jgi:hypothetical protein
VRLTAGHSVPIRVEYSTGVSIAGTELHLGWEPPNPALTSSRDLPDRTNVNVRAGWARVSRRALMQA